MKINWYKITMKWKGHAGSIPEMRYSSKRRVGSIPIIIELTTLLYLVTEQHCEVPECREDIWAACGIGSCLKMLCHDHWIDGSLSTIHERTCCGRKHITIQGIKLRLSMFLSVAMLFSKHHFVTVEIITKMIWDHHHSSVRPISIKK